MSDNLQSLILDIDRWIEDITDKDRQDILRIIINGGVVVDSQREKGNGTEIFYSDLSYELVKQIHAFILKKVTLKTRE
jgi:hypothetical protein